MTDDLSALHALLAGNAQHAKDCAVLGQAIPKEPFSPAVRQGDDQFADIVRWTLYAMVEAEEYGITSKNVDEMLKSGHPTIKNILGVTPGMGKALGVDEKWAYDIVKQVGNYGESYDRNLVAARCSRSPAVSMRHGSRRAFCTCRRSAEGRQYRLEKRARTRP